MDATIERLRRELSEGVAGLSAEQTQVRRAEGMWNVQQIVEHLLLTYGMTAEVVAGRVAKGTPTKAAPSMAQRAGQWMIAGLGIFPKGRLSPAAVSPGETAARAMSGKELEQEIARSLQRMDEEFAAAEAIFGPGRRAISHLVLGPMSVRQWRRFHLVHGEHHLKQIKATRKGNAMLERC